MLLVIYWSEGFHLHILRQKSNCSSHIVAIIKLTVSFSDLLKRRISVPRYTSSSLAFAVNATHHINVVLRKFAYSLMRRVTASPNIIVTDIVNSDAYQQSELIDKWEGMLYV